jgi:hypothetical protein
VQNFRGRLTGREQGGCAGHHRGKGWFDVHALSQPDTGYISATMRAVHDKSQPYDVAFRAPVARDVDGLLVADGV